MITKKGKYMADDLTKKTGNRDPDAFAMYVYNDFFAYAILDLVDEALTRLNTKIKKGVWDEAYSILEAITVYNNDLGSEWTQCDDGERVEVTNKAYGALAVAVISGLKKEDRLDATSFPSLESLLRGITAVGDMMEEIDCKSAYAKLSCAVARRLFEEKTDADLVLEKKQREEWFKSITDKQEKEVMGPAMKDMVKQKKSKPWFMKGEICDEAKRNSDYSLSPVWKEYKAYLATVPKGPLKCPCWDISTWSAADKRAFRFEFMDEMLDDF